MRLWRRDRRTAPGLPERDLAVVWSVLSGLLDYPEYTRPAEYEGHEVPEVLLSGHHANITKWRREQALTRTQERRPDVLEAAKLTDTDRAFITQQTKK